MVLDIAAHAFCPAYDFRGRRCDVFRAQEKGRDDTVLFQQVQDLTPTPMTLSSVMFYTGTDPYTGEKLFVARDQESKRRQKAWFFK